MESPERGTTMKWSHYRNPGRRYWTAGPNYQSEPLSSFNGDYLRWFWNLTDFEVILLMVFIGIMFLTLPLIIFGSIIYGIYYLTKKWIPHKGDKTLSKIIKTSNNP